MAEVSVELCVELELWSAVDGVLCCPLSEKHITVDRNNEETILIFIGSPELSVRYWRL